MGIIIDSYKYDRMDKASMAKPIVFCNPGEEMIDKAIAINIPMAEELQKQGSVMMRTMRMEQDLINVLSSVSEEPVIKDFDVMFNPEYQVDVIKVFMNVYRKKAFSVIWAGRYEDGKLYYAEEGYRDYKVFDVNDYDITVVI